MSGQIMRTIIVFLDNYNDIVLGVSIFLVYVLIFVCCYIATKE